jgi:hypothetical protein
MNNMALTLFVLSPIVVGIALIWWVARDIGERH